GADDHLGLRITLRPEYVGRIKPDTGRKGKNNVGHGGAVRRALMAFVRKRLALARHKNAAFDGMRLDASLPAALFQNASLDAAVHDAYGHAFPGGAGVLKQALRRQEREHLLQDIRTRCSLDFTTRRISVRLAVKLAHHCLSASPWLGLWVSPMLVMLSSRRRKSSTRRMQWLTAGGPCRTASTRIASAKRSVSGASIAAPGVSVSPSRSP